MTGLEVSVEPLVGLLDEPIRIRLAGLPPESTVELIASTRDDTGAAWTSSATFRTDAGGAVDLSHATPLRGSYSTPDPTGLFWSMSHQHGAAAGPFSKQSPEELAITITAVTADHPGTSVQVKRSLAQDVDRIPLEMEGLVGAAYLPRSHGPVPAVLVLGGSNGALPEATAALLASHGIAALAVAYFGRPGLPEQLQRIPLERFGNALQWLSGLPKIDGHRLGAIGTSKGGEAALLLGVHHQSLRAIVTRNGSGIHYEAVTARGACSATWTLGGHDLPYAPVKIDLSAAATATIHRPLETVHCFREAMLSPTNAEAEIPVERIRGQILMLASSDDRVWPSAELAKRVEARMIAHGRSSSVRIAEFPHAGHDLGEPHLPATGVISSRGGAIRALGGTASGNARARARAWSLQLGFLRDALVSTTT